MGGGGGEEVSDGREGREKGGRGEGEEEEAGERRR